jgi:hypothetical protein
VYQYFPDAQCDDKENSLQFTIMADMKQFSIFFTALDGVIEGIPAVKNITLNSSTLESVFLKLKEEETRQEE